MQKESIYNKMTRSEKEVVTILKELNIQWTYEQPLFVWDENRRPRVWAPDFYLTSFGIYLEVCGSESFDYEYRKRIFSQNGYRVIFLHLYKETNHWKNHLVDYLKIFTKYQNQKLNQILGKNELISE